MEIIPNVLVFYFLSFIPSNSLLCAPKIILLLFWRNKCPFCKVRFPIILASPSLESCAFRKGHVLVKGVAWGILVWKDPPTSVRHKADIYPALHGKGQSSFLLHPSLYPWKLIEGVNSVVVPVVQQVYRGTAGKEQDSIIGFYNKVYMVAMKSVILQFAPNKVRQFEAVLHSECRQVPLIFCRLYWARVFQQFTGAGKPRDLYWWKHYKLMGWLQCACVQHSDWFKRMFRWRFTKNSSFIVLIVFFFSF